MKITKQRYNPLHGLSKRLSAILAAMILLLPLLSALSLVGLCNGIGLAADREIRPGTSFTLRLSLDEAAIGYEGYFTYDSSVLTLTRTVPTNSGSYQDFQVSTDSGYVYVKHYEPVRNMVTMTFAVSSKAAVGTTTTVQFHSGKAITENGTETVGDSSFEFLVAVRKSSDATLKNLQVTVYQTETDRDRNENAFYATLAPSFSSDNESYSMTVAHQYAFFRIAAEPNDANAVISSVSDGELTAGAVNSVQIAVEAEDGTKNTYTVQIFRESASENSIDVSYPVSDVSPEESEQSSAESSDEPSEETASEESIRSDAESEGTSDETSSATSREFPVGSEPSDPAEPQNWTGIILCIAAVGALALVVLTVRIFVLFKKGRKKRM